MLNKTAASNNTILTLLEKLSLIENYYITNFLKYCENNSSDQDLIDLYKSLKDKLMEFYLECLILNYPDLKNLSQRDLILCMFKGELGSEMKLQVGYFCFVLEDKPIPEMDLRSFMNSFINRSSQNIDIFKRLFLINFLMQNEIEKLEELIDELQETSTKFFSPNLYFSPHSRKVKTLDEHIVFRNTQQIDSGLSKISALSTSFGLNIPLQHDFAITLEFVHKTFSSIHKHGVDFEKCAGSLDGELKPNFCKKSVDSLLEFAKDFIEDSKTVLKEMDNYVQMRSGSTSSKH